MNFFLMWYSCVCSLIAGLAEIVRQRLHVAGFVSIFGLILCGCYFDGFSHKAVDDITCAF